MAKSGFFPFFFYNLPHTKIKTKSSRQDVVKAVKLTCLALVCEWRGQALSTQPTATWLQSIKSLAACKVCRGTGCCCLLQQEWLEGIEGSQDGWGSKQTRWAGLRGSRPVISLTRNTVGAKSSSWSWGKLIWSFCMKDCFISKMKLWSLLQETLRDSL